MRSETLSLPIAPFFKKPPCPEIFNSENSRELIKEHIHVTGKIALTQSIHRRGANSREGRRAKTSQTQSGSPAGNHSLLPDPRISRSRSHARKRHLRRNA